MVLLIFSEISFEDNFEINPLIITSIAVLLINSSHQIQNRKVKAMVDSFSIIANKAYKILEYSSYVALGLNSLDAIFDSLDIADFIGQGIDVLDIFDLVPNGGDIADGVDMLDGLASFGLGILASKGVKHLMNKWNVEDESEIKKLRKKVLLKNSFRKLLKSDVPSPYLIGFYKEVL